MCVSSRREIVQETFLTNIYAQEEKQLSRSEKNLPQVALKWLRKIKERYCIPG